MNICLVTPHYTTKNSLDSGLGTHFSHLAKSLKSLGHNICVVLVTDTHEIDLPLSYSEDGIYINIIKVQIPSYINIFFRGKWAQQKLVKDIIAIYKTKKILKKLVKKYSIDIIETTNTNALCFAYMFNIKRPPIVMRISTTFEQILETYPFDSTACKILSWIEKLAIYHSDFLTTHTLAHRNIISENLKINLDRIAVITHGIPIKKILLTNNISAHKDDLIILYVGRFEPRKGIDIVVQAIPKVLQKANNIKFKLVGEDTSNFYRNKLQELLGTNISYVDFLGKVDQERLSCLYQECDIFIAPSRYESFGLIYAEAMSYGKPVIGCNVGGVPEVILDKVTGIILKNICADDLADNIIELSLSSKIRQEMGVNARKRVEDLFDVDKMAESTIQYYNCILSLKSNVTNKSI